MKLEDHESQISSKILNLSKLEQTIDSKQIEMRRYNQEVLNKINNFSYSQDALRAEVESQLELMKSQKFQETSLKKIVLDVIAPRDKIERENIKKYNRIFKALENKISHLNVNCQSVKKETDKNTDCLSTLESKILDTFESQIKEMKLISSSPGKGPTSDLKIEAKIKEIEERLNEKSIQTINLFDSAKEEIQHTKKNLEQLATLYSTLTDGVKKLHTSANESESEWKNKIGKIEKSFLNGFNEVKHICLDKLEIIDKKLTLEMELNKENQVKIEELFKKLNGTII